MSLNAALPTLLHCNLASVAPAAFRALQHLASLQGLAATVTNVRHFASNKQCTRSAAFSSKPVGHVTAQNPRAGLANLGTIRRGFAASTCSASEQGTVPELLAKVQEFLGVKENADTQILSQLAEAAMARANELTPEQIRNICVSFAELGFFNTQFKSVMADAVIEKLDQFEPSVLADTAWAFAEANYYDYDLMSTLLPYLKNNIEKFDACGMSKMLWTFGRFGYQDETLRDMMHDIAVKLQADCNSKSLAEVVYALGAQLGWADMRLHNLVAEYAMDNLQDFDSQSLAKLAYGLASVGYDDDALYTAITNAAASELDNMSPAEVSMILWACGEQGHMCDRFMSAVVESYLPANLASFTPQQLQTAVHAWNKLGYTNPAVTQAAVRLDEVLPHLAGDAPGTAAVHS